jgi:hypothetical protein
MSGIIETLSLLLTGHELLMKKIDELRPKEIQKVKIVDDAFELQKIYFDRQSTTNTKKPDKPDIVFENLDADTEIENLSVITGTDFKTKGFLTILIDGGTLLPEQSAAGKFTDVDVLNIPLSNNRKKFKRKRKIEFFIWSSDGTSVSITAFGLVGKQDA